MPQKPLKPHLIEANILKSMLTTFSTWMNLYKKLQSQEDMYFNLVESTENGTKKYYQKRLKKISGRLDILGKRINFTDMLKVFDKFTDRINHLYQIDIELQKIDK